MAQKEKIITAPKDTVAAILLVFVALLIKESIAAFCELGNRLEAFNFSPTWTFITILLYWINIIRISLGFAKYLDEGNAGYMMGKINFLLAFIGLLFSLLSVTFLSKNCWATNAVEYMIGNIKISWAFYYLLPNFSYAFWDLYLYFWPSRPLNEREKDRLRIWSRLDVLLIFILFFILFVPIAPNSPSAPIWLAIGTTVIIISIDLTRNKDYYFPTITTESTA